MLETKGGTIKREGGLAFPVEERETPAASSAAETTVEVTPKAEVAVAVPFNEDPKVQEYISRQVETRTSGLEDKLRKEFAGNADKIREEIGEQRKKNAEQTKIPAWFGGNQAQWDDYRSWMDGRLQEVETSAINKTFERATTQTKQQQDAVAEATEYFKGELQAIQADKALNPSGKAIDPEKLLKVVIDNDLVDSKGRWNYRAGIRFLNSHSTTVHAPKTGDKNLAAATMDGAGAGKGNETAPKPFKTGADFKKKRPW